MNNNKVETYKFHAYAGSGKAMLSKLRLLYPEQEFVRHERKALEIILAERKRIYVFEYATIVFLNIELDEQKDHLKLIYGDIGLRLAQGEDENFTADDYLLQIGSEKVTVRFNAVSLPDWDDQLIFVAAEVLSKSAALEVVEIEVSQLLQESEKTTELIEFSKLPYARRNKMLKLIAKCLRTKHQLISQLCLLQKPENTWENERLYILYRELILNFEIENRLIEVEKMVEIASEVSKFQLETLNTRRSEFLEIIIILLIAFEIVQAFAV